MCRFFLYSPNTTTPTPSEVIKICQVQQPESKSDEMWSEDIIELRSRCNLTEEIVKRLEEQLNPNAPSSWVATEQR